MAHLSPSAIFSPSVARQQLAAAKDWNYVDSWLSSKFRGKTPPAFERNNDTLKALLALAALNETADEERELLAIVEAKALQELNVKEEQDPNVQLLHLVENNLTREGRTALDALSSLGAALQQPLPDSERLAQGILDLQVRSFDLEQATHRVSILEDHLNRELDRINSLVEELESNPYQPSSGVTRQTVEYQRKAKVLATKLPELRDRLASLSLSTGKPKITLECVHGEEDKFIALQGKVKDLEVQVRKYHSLPQDTDLARLEIERVRSELRDLTQKRDSMFEGLVERESPQKSR
ncbi:hypothetical protein PVAG01_02964 [Phlyctema vagabunda]|uniref:HAUS augmin-like complex subunit 1 n=1 Tax=Phlyctema vagabunda TaxID=108571 RepID=A0ABR4PSJ9_9HELO